MGVSDSISKDKNKTELRRGLWKRGSENSFQKNISSVVSLESWEDKTTTDHIQDLSEFIDALQNGHQNVIIRI